MTPVALADVAAAQLRELVAVCRTPSSTAAKAQEAQEAQEALRELADAARAARLWDAFGRAETQREILVLEGPSLPLLILAELAERWAHHWDCWAARQPEARS